MIRVAQAVRLRPEKEDEYRRLHAAAWPSVLEQIRRSNIRNFSIYLLDGLLVGYFEYVGDDWEADMAAMSEDPATREWWTLTEPCQESLRADPDAPLWTPMVEVFHSD